MKAALADSMSILSFAIAPALLAVRFFWPRALPRWAVLLSAAVLGGALFYLSEMLYRADMLEKFSPIGFPLPSDMNGMVALQYPRPIEFILGAVLQLIYLLLWLVPYGVIRILLSRRSPSTRVAV